MAPDVAGFENYNPQFKLSFAQHSFQPSQFDQEMMQKFQVDQNAYTVKLPQDNVNSPYYYVASDDTESNPDFAAQRRYRITELD